MMYADLAPQLFENGWRSILPLGVFSDGSPTPIRDAKACRITGWGRRQYEPLTADGLAACVKRYPHAGIGCAFGPIHNLVAIDVDITDAELNRRAWGIVRETLPHTDFIRVGLPPKFLLMYRGQVRSRKYIGSGVEIFGSSGQTVLFAIHPKTGRPYAWPEDSPLDFTPDDLPEISQQQVDDFIQSWMAVAPRASRKSRPNGSHVAGGEVLGLYDELRRERAIDGAKAAARQLMRVHEGERYPTMLSVIGFLVARGHSEDEIAAFVDDHFNEDARTDEWGDPEQVARAMTERTIEKFGGDIDWEFEDE